MIDIIAVDSDYQKQGIGKQLMEYAWQLTKDLDCKGTLVGEWIWLRGKGAPIL